MHGSANLAQNLLAAGLVDRYHLLVFPVVLGSGKRLFSDDGPFVKLSVAEHAVYPDGVLELVYDVQHEVLRAESTAMPRRPETMGPCFPPPPPAIGRR